MIACHSHEWNALESISEARTYFKVLETALQPGLRRQRQKWEVNGAHFKNGVHNELSRRIKARGIIARCDSLGGGELCSQDADTYCQHSTGEASESHGALRLGRSQHHHGSCRAATGRIWSREKNMRSARDTLINIIDGNIGSGGWT